ncbi:MAG: hypothetical protein ACOYK6_05475 [Chthoniobacterales bacterium]
MKKIIKSLTLAAFLFLGVLSSHPCLAQGQKINPTRQELSDYINNKIAGHLDSSYLDKASELEKEYPNATLYKTGSRIYSPEGWLKETQSLWDQVDELVTGVYGVDFFDSDDPNLYFDASSRKPYHFIGYHYSSSDKSINDFIGRWGLSISKVENDSELPVGTPKKVVLLDNASQEERLAWAKRLPDSYKQRGSYFYSPQVLKPDADQVTQIKRFTYQDSAVPTNDESVVSKTEAQN